MLPHKVGRVVAHGVADPVLWATNLHEDYTWLNELLETDALKSLSITLQRFLSECHEAGQERCALTVPHDRSWEAIARRLEGYLDQLGRSGGVYSSVGAGGRRGLLTSGMIRSKLFASHTERSLVRLTTSEGPFSRPFKFRPNGKTTPVL